MNLSHIMVLIYHFRLPRLILAVMINRGNYDWSLLVLLVFLFGAGDVILLDEVDGGLPVAVG